MSQSPHNNNNWLWITLSLLALAVLILLLSSVIKNHFANKETEDSFQQDQETIDQFFEEVEPLNRVERKNLKDEFFGN